MLKNLSIGKRIAVGSAVTLLAMVVLTAVGMLQVNKINHALTVINDVNGIKERYAINFRGSVHDRSIAVRDVTLVPAAELPTVVSHIEQLEEAYRKSATPLDAIFAAGTDVSDEERAQLEKIKAAESKTMPLVHDVIEKQKAGAAAAAKKELLDLARPAFVQWLASINGMIDMEEKLNKSQVAVARGVGVDFQYLMLGITLLAITIGATVTAMLSISIRRALGCEPVDLQCLMDATGAGDLSVEVDIRDGDNTSVLASLHRMQATLRSTLREAGEAAILVSASSRELASAAEAIAGGAQQQAASLEETSASLEQITATVRQSADNAQQASQLATGSRDSAELGQGVVVDAVSAMAEINAASAKISNIISTIDEIAFQTNLLAVNAAVEAARAGDEGRGFAVVATEVRGLAQRSAGAAKEIKGLIQDSLSKVKRGMELVNRSGETLHGIVDSVKRVTDIVSDISVASQEQSTGIEQVNSAMTQMDQVTQSNSAHTEELSATAQTLSERSVQLLALVQGFKLGNEAKAENRASSQASFARSASAKATRMKVDLRTKTIQTSKTQKPRSHAAALVAVAAGPAVQEFEQF